MNKEILKKINNANWYRQGGTILPYITSMPYRAAFIYYDGFNYFRGKNNYGYFDKDKEKKVCDEILKKQLKDRSYIVNEMINPWSKLKKKQNIFIKKITKQYLSKLSEKEFLRVHKEFNLSRLNTWKICVLIEAFDPWGDKIINEYLSKYNIDINPEDLAFLMGPRKLNYLQKEILDRLKITRKLKLKNDIKQDLSNHSKKYYWISNSWFEVKYLDEDYFNKLINKDKKEKNEKISNQIKELEEYESKQKRKEEILTEKHKFPKEIENLFYFFSNMTDWRDERKAYSMKINYFAYLFLCELSKRTKISIKYLDFLEALEVKSISYLKSIKENIKKRQKGSIYYVYGKEGVKWFIGEEAKELHNLLDRSIIKSGEITGNIANKGRVKGHVKIIAEKKDFLKVQKGDVLVTQMTRPEHIPIISKAAAIVTDEGGITCHAAIISREFDIPCVIGTQTATSILKDNDLIEVDANKGIIKILKRAKKISKGKIERIKRKIYKLKFTYIN